jgi:hypothetical protein
VWVFEYGERNLRNPGCLIAHAACYWLTGLEAGSKRARFPARYGERVLSLEDLKARLAKIEDLEDTARRELRNLTSKSA